MWSPRFDAAMNPNVMAFQASLPFDQVMIKEDLMGSMAHVHMLAKCQILSTDECAQLTSALKKLYQEAKLGTLQLPEDSEDVHMAVEVLLTSSLGDVGKKVHTARSRNDQVAVDLKLFLRHELVRIMKAVVGLQEALLTQASAHQKTLMPGYTHLQRAQPITFGYHLLTYSQMLERDFDRLKDCLKHMDTLPLGSGAVSGVSYTTDRWVMAEALGFSRIAVHAMDAVSDRDHVLEALSVVSVIMIHLSRLSEEVILWSSQEFGFVKVSDGYATGSSMMPQKKNPDVAELIRGKSGRVMGSLMGMMTVMKGLPLAYNKDLQEDKEGLFDSLKTTHECLTHMAGLVASLKVNANKMLQATAFGFLNATEAADYLVKKGLPFREAYEIIGAVVKHADQEEVGLESLPLETLKTYSEAFDIDFAGAVSLETCMAQKVSEGSTGEAAIQHLLSLGHEALMKQSEHVHQLGLFFEAITYKLMEGDIHE